MAYFWVERLHGKPAGNPIFFDKTFDEASGGKNRLEDELDLRYTAFEASPLRFVCKHKVIDFDCYPDGSGEFFVSDRFWDVAETMRLPAHELIDIELVSKKGENVARTKYAVAYVEALRDAVDQERSTIVPDPVLSFMKRTTHLALREDVVAPYDLFRIEDMTFGGQLFCSSRFQEAIAPLKLNVELIAVEDAGAVFGERYPH